MSRKATPDRPIVRRLAPKPKTETYMYGFGSDHVTIAANSPGWVLDCGAWRWYFTTRSDARRHRDVRLSQGELSRTARGEL